MVMLGGCSGAGVLADGAGRRPAAPWPTWSWGTGQSSWVGMAPVLLPRTVQSLTVHQCQDACQAAAGLLGHAVLSLFWALPAPLPSWLPGEVSVLMQ